MERVIQRRLGGASLNGAHEKLGFRADWLGRHFFLLRDEETARARAYYTLRLRTTYYTHDTHFTFA